MLVALDYDNTYTADPKCFQEVIRCFQSCGHKVIIATMRDKELDYHPDFDTLRDNYDVETVFCDGNSKRKVTQLNGYVVDIWIDDWPEGIATDSIYTPIQLTEWREAQKKLF